jgi:hypothetical protein
MNLSNDQLLLPQSAGRDWRERFHAALGADDRLSPTAIIEALLTRLPEDPIGVFKAITATLPKELDVASQPQQHHLFLLRIVNQAHAQGVDLSALLTATDTTPEWLS